MVNNIRGARDTFLRFLADGLPGVVVHNVRVDKNIPEQDRGLKKNALNVEFLNISPQVVITRQTVSLDIVTDDELAAVDLLQKIWDLLGAGFYVEKKDYTDPLAPVTTGYNIIWDTDSVKFRPISNPLYYHLHCTLTLQFHLS